DRVAEVLGSTPITYETIAFHDIAGLVRGAHQGEGLGNQFLANIRETDAIVTELLYADLEQAERRLERVSRQAKSLERAAVAEEQWLRDVIAALQEGKPVRAVPLPRDAPDAMRNLQPLTAKPVLYVANVGEGEAEVP